MIPNEPSDAAGPASGDTPVAPGETVTRPGSGPTGPPLGQVLHPMARAVLFVAYWYLLFQLVPGVVYATARGVSDSAQLGIIYLILDLAVLGGSWLFIRRLDQRNFRTLGFWFFKAWSREFGAGSAIGAGLVAVVVAVFMVTRAVAYRGLAVQGFAETLASIAGSGAVLLMAAVFEELAFRGYGFQRLVQATGPMPAVFVFSALFGAVHLTNPHATLLAAFNTFLSGVLLSMAYLKTRALWMPIGLHWAWNLVMGPLASLPISGLVLGPRLFRAELAGPAWLTGGAYGPEGGVVLPVVCLVAILWLGRTKRLAPSPAMGEVLE